ncbi:hypothetical protein GCM10018785_23340 [Streptomyces longispororuber]|uniref:Uncharacterized protein n=1 Tax=Streptomyces longispororuber TaxID=68230 RepID=A0A919DK55_9ACTN|nr:hypothetical protein [Streptomyces longispororuber]GHE53113.1 hypothetical protein GCM10018785_23340 [Streptomyces longispororuber]
MLVVAILLLPALGLLLFAMDRLEDSLLRPTAARHAGPRRHLRLIPGGRAGADARRARRADPAEREAA